MPDYPQASAKCILPSDLPAGVRKQRPIIYVMLHLCVTEHNQAALSAEARGNAQGIADLAFPG